MAFGLEPGWTKGGPICNSLPTCCSALCDGPWTYLARKHVVRLHSLDCELLMRMDGSSTERCCLMAWASPERSYFSFLYTAAHVFNLMNTLICWAVLVHVPQGHDSLSAGGGARCCIQQWMAPAVFHCQHVRRTSRIVFSYVMFVNTIRHDNVSFVFLFAGIMTMARAVAHHVSPCSSRRVISVGSQLGTNKYGVGIVAACASGSVAMSPAGESRLSNDVGTGQCIG